MFTQATQRHNSIIAYVGDVNMDIEISREVSIFLLSLYSCRCVLLLCGYVNMFTLQT